MQTTKKQTKPTKKNTLILSHMSKENVYYVFISKFNLPETWSVLSVNHLAQFCNVDSPLNTRSNARNQSKREELSAFAYMPPSNRK